VTLPARTIYLVRHGDTSENAATPGPEIERGWDDVPLHPMGRKEARRIAIKLARLGIKAVISSDLRRGTQTADIVGDWLGIEPQVHSQLRTWNLGEVTGGPQKAADALAKRLVRAPSVVPPGGESFEQFKRRIFAAFADILATHAANPIAIIVHGKDDSLIRAWRAAGQKPDHAIDVDVFLRGPEDPGHIEEWAVDPIALKLSHDEADFGPARRHNTRGVGDRCLKCKAYGGPDDCTKVKPPMDDDDWCAVGVAKSDGHWFSGKV
jgi:broad specificity phosphatase PhoE